MRHKSGGDGRGDCEGGSGDGGDDNGDGIGIGYMMVVVMVLMVVVVMVHCCSKNLIIAPAAWARTEGSLSPSNTTRCGTHPTLQAWFFPSRGKLATNRQGRRVDEHKRMMEMMGWCTYIHIRPDRCRSTLITTPSTTPTTTPMMRKKS